MSTTAPVRPRFCKNYHVVSHTKKALQFRARKEAAAFPAGTLTPAQVCFANLFPKVTPVRTFLIGIVSLGGAFSASDLAMFCSGNSMPVPNVQTITANGGSQDPTDSDSTVENMLDVECLAAAWWFCTGVAANIVECFSANDALGIAAAIDALVAAGCKAISCSWGQAATQWSASSRAATAASIAAAVAAGVCFFSASGDNSLNDNTSAPTPDYPSCDVNCWAVGGTSISINPDGTRLSEKAWGDGNSADEGGGGGYDPTIHMPSYQNGIVTGSAFRGTPDSSLNADPDTGYQMVSGGQWQVVGGTSASTPMTCGGVSAVLACLATPISNGNLGSILYPADETAFYDIVLGSNGSPAVVGWDTATGIGSIKGSGLVPAFTGTTPVPVPTPTPVPVPTPVPPPVPTPTPTPTPIGGTTGTLTVTKAIPVGSYPVSTTTGSGALSVPSGLAIGVYQVSTLMTPLPPPSGSGPTEQQVQAAVDAVFAQAIAELGWYPPFKKFLLQVQAAVDQQIKKVFASAGAAPQFDLSSIDWSEIGKILQLLGQLGSILGGLPTVPPGV